MAKLKTNGGLNELGAFLVQNGFNVPKDLSKEYEEEKQEFAEENSADNFSNIEDKEKSNINIETEAENIINDSKEVISDISGIPGAEMNNGESVEPTSVIEEVSSEEVEDPGVISEDDEEERLIDLKKAAEEIDEIDGIEDDVENENTRRELDASKYVLLAEVDKMIREMSPELFESINKNDFEIINKVENLLIDVKDNQKVTLPDESGKDRIVIISKTPKAKLFELASKNKITALEVLAFQRAKSRMEDFINRAENEGISKKNAATIYRTHIDLIENIRNKEAENISKNEDEEIVEDTVEESQSNEPEEVSIPETMSEEEVFTPEEKEEEVPVPETQAKKEVIDSDSLRIEKVETNNGGIQSKEYNELIDLYDECLNKAISVKSEIEKQNFLHIISNLKKLIEKINSQKGKYAMDNILIYKSYIYDLRRDLNYILESEAPAPLNNEEESSIPVPEDNEKELSEENDFEKQAKDVEKRVEAIARESKEKNLSEFEKKVERFREIVVRCSELASTIENVDLRRSMVNSINILITKAEKIYNDNSLTEEQKSSKICNSIKELLTDIDKYQKPKSKKIKNEIGANSEHKAKDESENNPSLNKEPKPISEKVYSEYEKVGVGLDTLKEIEGFDELSAGQQLLMLKNYNAALFDKLNIDTKNEANAEWQKKTFTGKLGRFGLSIITLGTAKTFKEKRKQKEVASRLLQGGSIGFENRKTLLQSLVNVAKESPSVHLDKNGELQIDYVDTEKYSNDPDAYNIINAYNEAASKYANIPRSWFDNNIDFNGKVEESNFYLKLLGTKHRFLSGKEHAMLADAKDEYEEARENYINLMLEQLGDTPENRRNAMKELNLLDERVKMNQLFVSNPNAEALLQDAKDASIFNQTMSEFISKRGQYMAYGSVARMAAVATVTSIAAPVGLAVVGGLSYLRGKREVRDMLKMRRVSGSLNEKDLKEDVVYNVDLHESYSLLNEALKEAKNKGDKQSEIRITEKINSVKDKISSGHNFERHTRKLGEFREAKFFSERVENLVAKYEMLKDSKGQEKDAELIELKIAQTATLMRELMNNGMLHYGEKGDDSKSVVNRLAFIQALSLADTTISLDTSAIEKKMADIVDKRREVIDDLDTERGIKYCRRAVATAVAFGSVGYALTHTGINFFTDNTTISNSLENSASNNGTNIDTSQDSNIIKEGIEKIENLFDRELPDGYIRLHDGETLQELIISRNPRLSQLSPNAQNNAVTNFLNNLDAAKLKEIGLTSNPHNVKTGQAINIDKLEEYFDEMRVDGKSLIEKALQVTGGKNIETPDVGEEIEIIRSDIESNENPNPSINGRSADITESIQNYTDGSLEDFEVEWATMSNAEKAASWNTVIPRYIERHIGDSFDEFVENGDKIEANELSRYMENPNLNPSDSRGKMLKSIADSLKQRGLTPEEGYDYGDKNLRDYVNQVYRSSMMIKGIESIR